MTWKRAPAATDTRTFVFNACVDEHRLCEILYTSKVRVVSSTIDWLLTPV
jgi:hypothetical protein